MPTLNTTLERFKFLVQESEEKHMETRVNIITTTVSMRSSSMVDIDSIVAITDASLQARESVNSTPAMPAAASNLKVCRS